jgi:glucose-6-phosphate 1-epimerase
MNEAQLNEKFGKAGVLEFGAGTGGLTCAQITTAACTATVYLHGAHLAAWTPAGRPPVLFLSQQSWFEREKPLRGGVPICWPWFGPHATKSTWPGHGFARLMTWEVEATRIGDAGKVAMVLLLKSSAATRQYVPWDFELRHRITVGPQLIMKLETTNTGLEAMRIEEALHTYFAVGDVRTARVLGLNGKVYLDKVDGFKRKRQHGAVTFHGETDRVYLETPGTTKIIDPAGGRTITIDKAGSANTVVWNPWVEKARHMADFGEEEWPGMLCVETANVGVQAVAIKPGERHELRAVISVGE